MFAAIILFVVMIIIAVIGAQSPEVKIQKTQPKFISSKSPPVSPPATEEVSDKPTTVKFNNVRIERNFKKNTREIVGADVTAPLMNAKVVRSRGG
jgi:hypothetical protein